MKKCLVMRWNGKRIVRWYHRNPNIAKNLKEIVTGENYLWLWCESVTVTLEFFLFSLFIFFIHISASMSPFGLKFSQMILPFINKKTGVQLILYLWSLHKPTLLPSTFNANLNPNWFVRDSMDPFLHELPSNVGESLEIRWSLWMGLQWILFSISKLPDQIAFICFDSCEMDPLVQTWLLYL